MATIYDVAQLAGVAPATVSRLLNQSGYVSEQARQRIEQAVAELHYVPNTLARSLHFKATHTLGLLLPDIINPMWTSVARGAEDAAQKEGFNVILCNTDSDVRKQDEYVEVLLQKQVDGLMFVPFSNPLDLRPIQRIQRQNTPLVILDYYVPELGIDTVLVENEKGAHALTQLVIELGHERIALLSGVQGHYTAEERKKGYLRALREAGLPIDERLVLHGAYVEQGGYEMVRQALAVTPGPTALVAGNNVIAVGALRALRERGLRVPEDLGLVCFDDIPMASAIDPFLTVAAQPCYELGKKAIELLIARIRSQEGDNPRLVSLPVEIIRRRSCGPLRR